MFETFLLTFAMFFLAVALAIFLLMRL